MVEYYFDVETTGRDPQQDEVITIQRQPIKYGKSDGPIEILKSWESSEKEIISQYLDLAHCDYVWDFVYIGTNLLFDFNFINERSKKYGLLGTDFEYCKEQPHIDLKHVLILLNGGKFKKYSEILGKGTQLDNSMVPEWYKRREYDKIIKYIKLEAKNTIDFYGKMLKYLPPITKKI